MYKLWIKLVVRLCIKYTFVLHLILILDAFVDFHKSAKAQPSQREKRESM